MSFIFFFIWLSFRTHVRNLCFSRSCHSEWTWGIPIYCSLECSRRFIHRILLAGDSLLHAVLFRTSERKEKNFWKWYFLKWQHILWSVVWSSLLCLRFCCFPLHFGEVFARRLSRVLFETATELSRIVESRTIGDFGDIHFVITLHILERSCDTVRYDKIYRGAVE